MFDNGSHPGPPRFNVLPVIKDESSALVLRLSGKGDSRKASLVNRYAHEPDPIVALTQGSARILDGGNSFVGWGQVPQMTEFAPNGEVVWDAKFGVGGFPLPQHSYRAFKAPWQGFPKDRPAIASEADGDGAKLYASWNGATKVRSWKVFTGETAGSLTQVGSSPWKNLETMISIPTVDTNVRVVAYDKDGKKLGQSGLVPLGEQSR